LACTVSKTSRASGAKDAAQVFAAASSADAWEANIRITDMAMMASRPGFVTIMNVSRPIAELAM
jgi:hypothetical protein